MAGSASDRNDEFAELVGQHQTRLFGYIFAIVPNMADAEDIYQNTVLALWQKFNEYQLNTNFAAWARTAAHFEVQHYFRGKSRCRIHFDEELLAELAETQNHVESCGRDSTSESYLDALIRCKDKLPEDDRWLVEFCYEEKGGVTFAAEQLGRSPQSICNSLSRIRRVLFDCIQRVRQVENK